MNYTEVLNSIKNASLFDLYRLYSAISNELENSVRIKKLREKFKDGDIISYFDYSKNALIDAVVIQKKTKNVLVQNLHDKARWSIPYYWLNLDQSNVDLQLNPKEKLTKNHLKVGDCVGFNHDGAQIVGVVIRMNHKTASLLTMDDRRWRVSYGCLFKIIDGETANGFDMKKISGKPVI